MFFKNKTAYDMRISDWSSDVCSSDLFHDQLVAELRELWSEGYGYKLNIGTYHTGHGSKMKFLAAVPHPKDYERFFVSEFDAFVRKVKRREIVRASLW